MAEWIQDTLTFKVVIGFIIGLLAGQLANWAQYRYRLMKDPSKVVKRSSWEAVIGIMAVITLVWIMVSTQQARNCAIALNVAVGQEQVIAKIERDSFAKAVTQSMAVPAEIQALPQNDPVYKKYMDPIRDEYLASTMKAREMREANQANQEAAEKACGR